MKNGLEWSLAALLVLTTAALGGTPALAWSLAGSAVSALLIVALCRGALQFFLAQWTSYFAAGFVAFDCVRRGGGRILIRTLIWLAAAQALFGVLQYLTGFRRIFWYEKTRYLEDATGTYVNHNHFAGLLVLALAPALALGVARLLAGKPRGRLYCGVAVLLLLGLLFSRSRMGIAAGLAAFIFFGAYLWAKLPRRRAVSVIAVIPLAALVYGAWIGLGPVASRFARTVQQPDDRLTIWTDSWRLVEQRPLFGWGAGTFPAVYGTVRTEASDLRWMEAHNDYLQFLCELGVVGLLLFFVPLFVLVGRLTRRAWRSTGLESRGRAALAASLAGILLHELVDFHLYIPANAFWIMTLVGMGYAQLSSGRPPRSVR
jgi:O-antigen ligase